VVGVNVPGADQAWPPDHDRGDDVGHARGDDVGHDRRHDHGPDTALARELGALALVALDRLDPLLARLRAAVVDGPARDAGGGAPGCVVCATLAVVRAERPELAGRLAARATDLAAALRAALTEHAGAAAATPATATAAPSARAVQRIPVDRVPTGRGPAGRGTSC
jgi:hypothetical protein